MGAESFVNNSVFIVNIYGIELSFSKISGIGSTAEFDTYTEGGGRVHILPKPQTNAGTLIFEKGISVIDKQTASIFVAGSSISDISITLMKNGNIAESYFIESGIITSWELGELDAISSGVAIKKFQISHTGLKIG